jgi:hypothetical protein
VASHDNIAVNAQIRRNISLTCSQQNSHEFATFEKHPCSIKGWVETNVVLEHGWLYAKPPAMSARGEAGRLDACGWSENGREQPGLRMRKERQVCCDCEQRMTRTIVTLDRPVEPWSFPWIYRYRFLKEGMRLVRCSTGPKTESSVGVAYSYVTQPTTVTAGCVTCVQLLPRLDAFP